MFTAYVCAVEDGLKSLVADLDPDAIALPEVPELWAAFDRVERLAASAKTLLARRVEEAATFRNEGFRSAEEQMANKSGTTISTAKNALATSKRVKKLPKTAAAMRNGELSPAKAEAIAEAATIAPEAEDSLLAGADKAPLADLQERCLKAKAKNADETYRRIRRNRYARVFRDGEGAWNLRARGTVDDGARFMTVLQPLIDALIEMADLAGDTSPDAETSKPKRTPAKYLGLIRVDYETLARGAIAGGERCEITGLGPIPVAVARALLGDAILKLVITKGVDVANITHLGRSPTVAQQVALWWSARECQRDSCTRTERLENDHRNEWHKCHETRLDNIDPLCGSDHWLKATRAGRSSKALANGRWFHPRIRVTRRTNPRNDACYVAIALPSA